MKKKIEEENGEEREESIIKIPRLAKHQQRRANYSTTDPQEYHRLSVFLPFFDHLI